MRVVGPGQWMLQRVLSQLNFCQELMVEVSKRCQLTILLRLGR